MTDLTIIWFRQDLRIEDHPALLTACERGRVLPVYIYDESEKKNWSLGASSKWWLHYSLKNLSNELQTSGYQLVLRKGKALETLKQVLTETGASAVYWSRCYEPASLERDAEIKKELIANKIDVQSFNASLLFEPWTVVTKQGKPYQVFTPFWNACQALPSPPSPLAKPPKYLGKQTKVKSLTIEELNLLPKIHWDRNIQQVWKPGALEAKALLSSFLNGAILNYEVARNDPAIEGTSSLSPYLHFGEISPRMIWHEILKIYTGRENEVDSFLRQLGWREFAYYLLYHFPKTTNQPLKENFMQFPWKQSFPYLLLWQKGNTGYPFVDAGMRQLWQTGWMHNRVRMVVGSFLVKDLLITWVEGAKWFWNTLVDADLANNTLGWQWVGGCGADAAPYFRIFNPTIQGEKFDPSGNYIRRWVPELANLSSKWIHKPWQAPEDVLKKAGIKLGENYPAPIVDHASARMEALAAFSNIKKNDV